jgi:hypothetical protein
MTEFDDTRPSDSILGDILARTGTFKFRVARLAGGGFGVFADQFPIENYPSEEQAKALCNRLSRQQFREIQKNILEMDGSSHLPPQNDGTEYD